MSFGYSVGDIATICTLTYKAIQLVKASKTASEDCQDIVTLLEDYRKAIQTIDRLVIECRNEIPVAHKGIADSIAAKVQTCHTHIKRFLDSNIKYINGLLSSDEKDALRKVRTIPGWWKLLRQFHLQIRWSLRAGEVERLGSLLGRHVHALQMQVDNLKAFGNLMLQFCVALRSPVTGSSFPQRSLESKTRSKQGLQGWEQSSKVSPIQLDTPTGQNLLWWMTSTASLGGYLTSFVQQLRSVLIYPATIIETDPVLFHRKCTASC